MDASHLFTLVLDKAISDIQARQLPVFTFALYHDHESAAVSVCVDTEESSNRAVQSMNRFNMKYFLKAVGAGDLHQAALWQANVGRSLSLGDFALVNVARTPLGSIEVNDRFYIDMVQAVIAKQAEIAALAPHPAHLVFASSGAEDEVAYVWSLPIDA
jgi:hypothetical protein